MSYSIGYANFSTRFSGFVPIVEYPQRHRYCPDAGTGTDDAVYVETDFPAALGSITR
jgi:hypothetical protein